MFSRGDREGTLAGNELMNNRDCKDATFIVILTLFFQMFYFDPLENPRKPKFFWCLLEEGEVKREYWEEKDSFLRGDETCI